MLDKLRKQVAVEFEQLDKLIVVHCPLLDKCEKAAPTDIELSALAAMMHSFYTGIETCSNALPLNSTATCQQEDRGIVNSLIRCQNRATYAVPFFQRSFDIDSRSISSSDTFSGRHIRFSLNGKNYLHWCSRVKRRCTAWKMK